MNMQSEPIRLPLWLASLLSAVVIPFAVALLTDVDLKQALATALLAVIPLLGAGEVARRTAWSPESHEAVAYQRELFSNKVPTLGHLPSDPEPTTGAPDRGAADFVGVLVAIALIVAIAAGLRYLGVW